MKISDWLISIIAGTIFIIISSWHLSLPGLQYDESLSAAPAVNFLIKDPQTEPMQIDPSVIKIFGRPLPVMIMTYIGPVKTLLYIPVFWLFDISVNTVRFLPIIFVFFCFPLAYYIFFKLFNRELALIVVTLMSVDPSIVFYLTRDVGPAALQVFLKLFAIVLLIKWWNTNGHKFLYISFFTFGLGVTHKVDFLWVIVGLSLSFGIIYLKSIKRKLTFKNIIFSTIFFCLGALPIVVFNIVTGGYTFSPLISKLSSPQPSVTYSFLDNLLTRISQLIEIHNGNFISFLFCEKEVYPNILKHFFSFISLLSIISIVISIIRSKKPDGFLNAIAVILFIIIVAIETCFSPTELSGHHLLAITPFLIVLIVYGILTTSFLNRMVRYIILFLFFISLFYSSITINRLLNDTGGTGSWSVRIYDLNRYLISENKDVYALDWGFTNNLIVLSKSKLKINRLYIARWHEQEIEKILKDAMRENSLFLAHSDKYTSFKEVKLKFFGIAKEIGYRVVNKKNFIQQNGDIVYEIYCLERD